MFETVLAVNISATLFMTGLIWFVQLVHYPGFRIINQDDFSSFHAFHTRRTGYVVIPPMLAEIVTSFWLTLAFERLWTLNSIGLLLVLGIWFSTFLLQVRYHAMLSGEERPEVKNKLVRTNWIRTILWSAKSILGLMILFKVIK